MILNIAKENNLIILNSLYNSDKVIELNLSEIKNIEIPTSILLQLQKLNLVNISNLKFVNNISNDNISMNSLKHLYINNISFDNKSDNNFKIFYNNLKYLDLRLKEQEGYDDENDENIFDNNKNKSGFYKENIIDILINTLNLQFLTTFPIDTNKYKSKIEDYDEGDLMKHKNLIEEKYKYLVDIFKLKDKELFSNKDILKLDYFNFEILHEYYRYNFGEFAERFLYQYIFSKAKGNKYLFKVIYNEYENCNGNLFDITNEEIKYCDNNNYNEYYFYDNKLDAKESSYYYKIVNNEKIKSLYLIDNNDDYLEQFKKIKIM